MPPIDPVVNLATLILQGLYGTLSGTHEGLVSPKLLKLIKENGLKSRLLLNIPPVHVPLMHDANLVLQTELE